MTLSKRGGIFTNELVVLLLIISIGAALARPRIREARLQSLVSAAVADMDLIRGAAGDYQASQDEWPSEVDAGVVPPGLSSYLPEGFDFHRSDYTLDYDNWGGTPFEVGVTVITSNADLGLRLLARLGCPSGCCEGGYSRRFISSACS